ncbi:hypothetical protein G6F43_000238 [Rhizopus delemar]|nr:hypothetical protein G6F43_000238 [Rhizopus delemar]
MNTSKERIVIDYAPLTLRQKLQIALHRLPKSIVNYLTDLLPIIQWIHHYNTSWLIQDMIAGITVGMLIVPQGIAYAKIANLDPQYGLYTSFVGVSLYCFFGTSKDISIGPITIVSLLVGQAITQVKNTHPEITGPEVAVTLSLFAGVVTLLVSLTRLGALVEFISEPTIAGYMTGSAITISFGQWPKLFGVQKVDTHDADYKIFYEFFKNLNTTRIDAAFGLVTLFILYGVRWGSARLSKRFSRCSKFLFFFNIMRSGLVVIVGTLISFLINRKDKDHPIIDIIEEVPAGFEAMAIPSLNFTVLKEASTVLPSIVVILILEHISVAKAFSRTNNYTINSNQEILAIGLRAFSRTAVMARSGAKTPIAGVFSGAVVVLALYVLTPAFYYIPEAVLAAVVIHAVLDLMAGPKFLKALWKTSIIEFMIFVITVIIACFLDIETAIYVSVGLYILLLFIRLSRPPVVSVGRIRSNTTPDIDIRQIQIYLGSESPSATESFNEYLDDIYNQGEGAHYIYVDEEDPNFSNLITALPEGILIIRPTQSILYPSANYISEYILNLVKARTRPANSNNTESNADVKPWNEVVSRHDVMQRVTAKPYLKAIVFDFCSVYRLDVTAIHVFLSLKSTIEKYARKEIEWHFCRIPNQDVRQLLIQSGFGQLPSSTEKEGEMVMNSSSSDAEAAIGKSTVPTKSSYYLSKGSVYKESTCSSMPIDKYPTFHWDIESAIQSINERIND